MKLLVVLPLIVALCYAQQSKRRFPSYKKVPYKGGKIYTYDYTTSMKVINPIQPDQLTSIKIMAKVKLWFATENAKLKVVMELVDPTIKYLELDPKKSTVPIEKLLSLERQIKLLLIKPVVFNYKEGVVSVIKHHPSEQLWTLNLKKGIINMFHVNIHASEKLPNLMEESIHGSCLTTYATDKLSAEPFTLVQKTIDITSCKRNVLHTYSNIYPIHTKSEQLQTETPLKGVTAMTYNVTKTESGFKINRVDVIGDVLFHPLGDSQEGIVSSVNQTLVLVKEQAYRRLRPIPRPLKATSLKMKIYDPKEMTVRNLNKLIKNLRPFISKLTTWKEEAIEPMTKEMSIQLVGFVERLRWLTLNQVERLWTKLVQYERRPVAKEWLVRILSLVNTKEVMKVMLNKLQDKRPSISKSLINEYILSLGSTPFVDAGIVSHIEDICKIPVVTSDKLLTKTCLVTMAQLVRTQCTKDPFCTVRTPKILLTVLDKLTEATHLPHEYSEKEILEYIIIAETIATDDVQLLLVKIAQNQKLPVHIRVRSILALRPVVLVSTKRVIEPLFKLIKSVELPEDLRLAAVTVILQNPSPKAITGLLQIIKSESSLNIKKFILSKLITMSEDKELPREILRVVTTVKQFIIQEKLVPVVAELIPRSFLKTIKPFVGVEDISVVLKNDVHYTNKSILPRNLMSHVDLKILGKQICLLDLDLSIEGLQELIQKLVGLVPKRPEELTPEIIQKVKKIFEKVSAVPVQDEDIRVFLNLKLFGKQMETVYTAWKLQGSKLIDLISGQALRIADIMKDLSKGYEFNLAKIFMPVDVTVKIPTCAGVLLIHDLKTVVLGKISHKISAETTPSLNSWKALFISIKKINANVELQQRSTALIKGSVLFSLPIIESGLRTIRVLNIQYNTKLSAVVDLKTLKYTTDIALPTVKDVLKQESEIENVVVVSTAQRRDENVVQPILPKFDQMTLIHDSAKLIERQAKVVLSVGSKYLDVIYSKTPTLKLQSRPVEWTLLRHGKTGRIITLFKPNVGYLTIHPLRKTLIISKTTPTYFIQNFTANRNVLIALVSRVSKFQTKIPSTFPQQLLDIAAIFQREQFETEETQKIYKMWNEDYHKNEVVVVTDIFRVASSFRSKPRRVPVALVTRRSVPELLRESIVESPRCYGKESQYQFCVAAYLPKLIKSKLLSVILSPMLVEVTLPKQNSQKIRIVGRQVQSTAAISIHKVKVILVGTVPQRGIVVTATQKKIEREISLTVDPLAGSQTEVSSRWMCTRIQYANDTLIWKVSLEPTCQIQHLQISVNGTSIVPRHAVQISFNATTRRLPRSFYTILPYLPVVTRFVDELLSKPLYHTAPVYVEDKPLWNVLPTCENNMTLNGSVEVSLLTETRAQIIISTPLRRYIHKVTLPYPIYSLPIGSINYPLVEKVQHLPWPRCFHGRDQLSTFGNVLLKYQPLTDTCEQILIQNCSASLPYFLVTVRDASKSMKIVKIVVEDSEIVITPTEYNEVPTVTINGQSVQLTENILTTTLKEKYTVKFVFEPVTNTFVVLNKNLGLELTLVGGKSVSTSVSPLLSGKICGLCGSMSADRTNELITPERVPVRNSELFGMSWIVPGTECESRCPLKRMKPIIKIGVHSQCKPLVKIPVCREECRPIKTRIVDDVPVSCAGELVKTSIRVPTECKCQC